MSADSPDTGAVVAGDAVICDSVLLPSQAIDEDQYGQDRVWQTPAYLIALFEVEEYIGLHLGPIEDTIGPRDLVALFATVDGRCCSLTVHDRRLQHPRGGLKHRVHVREVALREPSESLQETLAARVEKVHNLDDSNQSLHLADCTDCQWSREANDLYRASEHAEDHQLKEYHEVDIVSASERGVAGGDGR